ncbi:HU family DNA-binding protein [Roseimarinus sediminis]|uniref:HU family DNA-binding protein n=1 Tax=Roseimarinus sediminis TaxID=1610899 RepID=UPI003D22D176
MTVKFKVIEKGQPGVVGGGEKKFYATVVSSGEITLEGMTSLIEESSTASGADIRAVLYAMVSVASRSLSNGQIVRLGDLGSLRLSISSEPAAEVDKVSSSAIKSKKVIFTPGPKLKEMMNNVKFEKTS